MFSQGFYAAPERHQPHYQQPQDNQQNPQSDQQAPGREGTSTCVHHERVPQSFMSSVLENCSDA